LVRHRQSRLAVRSCDCGASSLAASFSGEARTDVVKQAGFLQPVQFERPLFRIIMKLWPPFFALRIHIVSIAPDWRDITIRMKLSLRNRNYVGSHFGGGLFAMTDPFFMLMLMNILGNDYLVWDKSANIRFLKPDAARSLPISAERGAIDEVRERTASGENASRPGASISSCRGEIIASVDKHSTFAASRKNRQGSAKMAHVRA